MRLKRLSVQQKVHIANGRFDLAMKMEMDEAILKFGDKYKKRMARGVDYAKEIGKITSAQASKLKKLCR